MISSSTQLLPARYDLLSVILICLGNPDDKDYINNEFQKLLRLLSVLVDEDIKAQEKLQILDKEYDIATSNDWKGKVNTMCNWAEGLVDRVTEKVTRQVTQQLNTASVENVMQSLNVSAEMACEILKIKFEDYELAKQYV